MNDSTFTLRLRNSLQPGPEVFRKVTEDSTLPGLGDAAIDHNPAAIKINRIPLKFREFTHWPDTCEECQGISSLVLWKNIIQQILGIFWSQDSNLLLVLGKFLPAQFGELERRDPVTPLVLIPAPVEERDTVRASILPDGIASASLDETDDMFPLQFCQWHITKELQESTQALLTGTDGVSAKTLLPIGSKVVGDRPGKAPFTNLRRAEISRDLNLLILQVFHILLQPGLTISWGGEELGFRFLPFRGETKTESLLLEGEFIPVKPTGDFDSHGSGDLCGGYFLARVLDRLTLECIAESACDGDLL